MDKCYVDGCQSPPKYVIEWYGVNQDGENPRVVCERPVCERLEHLVESSHHDDFGGTPDGIVDIKTLEVEHPSLLAEVIKNMD